MNPNEAMTGGGDYTREPRPTLERFVASLLVAARVITAFHLGGLPLAIRATLLFGFPFLFIWLPGSPPSFNHRPDTLNRRNRAVSPSSRPSSLRTTTVSVPSPLDSGSPTSPPTGFQSRRSTDISTL